VDGQAGLPERLFTRSHPLDEPCAAEMGLGRPTLVTHGASPVALTRLAPTSCLTAQAAPPSTALQAWLSRAPTRPQAIVLHWLSRPSLLGDRGGRWAAAWHAASHAWHSI